MWVLCIVRLDDFWWVGVYVCGRAAQDTGYKMFLRRARVSTKSKNDLTMWKENGEGVSGGNTDTNSNRSAQ